jgi:hypothetical protein
MIMIMKIFSLWLLLDAIVLTIAIILKWRGDNK